MEVWVDTPYSAEWVWNLDMGWFGLVLGEDVCWMNQ
jgi:hypothetical protein